MQHVHSTRKGMNKKTGIELQNVVYPCVYHDKLLQIEGICLACFSCVSFSLENDLNVTQKSNDSEYLHK